MLTKRNLIKSNENLNKLNCRLFSLFKFLDDVYHINAGGCCFTSAVLAKLLEEDDIDYTVAVYDCDYDDFYDISCSQFHYSIIVNGIIVNPMDEDNDYSEFENVSSIDLMDHYKECDWNDYYNRFRNKYIKGLIKKFYKDFTYDLREEQSESNSK